MTRSGIDCMAERLRNEETTELGVGGGEWELIAEEVLALAAASVTFNNIPGTYRTLVLQLQVRTTNATEGDYVDLRFNNDSGANNYAWFQMYHRCDSTITYWCDRNDSDILLVSCEAANSLNYTFATANCWILGYARDDRYKLTFSHLHGYWGDLSADADVHNATGRGLWKDQSAITRIDLFPLGGPNFAVGCIFTLYGIY